MVPWVLQLKVDGSGRAGELAKGVGQRGKHWLLDYKNGYLVLIFFFMSEFRFENLEIWKRSIEIDDLLFELSERAEKKGIIGMLSNYVQHRWVSQIILLKAREHFQTETLRIFWFLPEGQFLNVLTSWHFFLKERLLMIKRRRNAIKNWRHWARW